MISGTSNPRNGTQLAAGLPPRTKICVYCGSSTGSDPAHLKAARELAQLMAARQIDLGKPTRK